MEIFLASKLTATISNILLVGISMVLFGIAVQDFKSRSVYVFWFPVLTLFFLLSRYLQDKNLVEVSRNVAINLGFLLSQFLLLSLYFSIKANKRINLIKGWLGSGDIFFLISIGIYLSALNFLFFYLTSLTLILICWICWKALSGSGDNHIPLAGFQALFFAGFFISDRFYQYIDLTSDDWLMNYLLP